ncbi:helix-turn-helix domain-containing protein [Streptomyces sp. NPDC006739]|uniref:helix-turn-helix domain-containing protein n=1 Tax=Streptomyces sp. NPDC006739 TaxID=3364763 RepID=UPI0036CBF9F4
MAYGRNPVLTGLERAAVAADCAARYRRGWTIRAIALYTGRSYGLIQKLLHEADALPNPHRSTRIHTH